MQLHNLQRSNKQKSSKRVGRGGKKGTYSGKGVKGQKSRAGRKMQPPMRELIKRYHKLPGYRQPAKLNFCSHITLSVLEKRTIEGETINPIILLEKNILRRIKGRVPNVKIVARGTISKKLIFENCSFSEKALEMVKKSGATIK